jgi:hypothetical protein
LRLWLKSRQEVALPGGGERTGPGRLLLSVLSRALSGRRN